MSEKNYYELLGLQQDATLNEIKKSYKNCVSALQTDAIDTEEKLHLYAKAYLTLSNENKRKKYDYFLSNPDSNYDYFSDNYFFGQIINKMNQMNQEINNMNQEINNMFNYFNDTSKNKTFIKNSYPNNSKHYSKHYECISFFNDNGQKEATSIEQVNTNGQIFQKKSTLKDGKWYSTSFYPNGSQKNISYDDKEKIQKDKSRYRLKNEYR